MTVPHNFDGTPTSVVIAGLGGQGVVKASDILAQAACLAGYDVKKSEIHGMSQRGGSVSSDVRFGTRVWSPMTPGGAADYLVLLAGSQLEANRHRLKPHGMLITPEWAPHLLQPTGDGDQDALNERLMNVALLGVLSGFLDIAAVYWLDAVEAYVPQKYLAQNRRAFLVSRAVERVMRHYAAGTNGVQAQTAGALS